MTERLWSNAWACSGPFLSATLLSLRAIPEKAAVSYIWLNLNHRLRVACW